MLSLRCEVMIGLNWASSSSDGRGGCGTMRKPGLVMADVPLMLNRIASLADHRHSNARAIVARGDGRPGPRQSKAVRFWNPALARGFAWNGRNVPLGEIDRGLGWPAGLRRGVPRVSGFRGEPA